MLKDHLEGVAKLAEERGNKFGAAKISSVVGLLHDLGKYSTQFQNRLHGRSGKVDHTTAGAQEVAKICHYAVGQAMAFTIAGHHGGLPNGIKGDPKNLSDRLMKTDIPNYQNFKNEIKIPELTNEDLVNMPKPIVKEMAAFSFAFCIRMIFSCLVDADFLDTERFMNTKRFSYRPNKISMNVLLNRLESTLKEFEKRNQKNATPINTVRQDILKRCLSMAESPRGFYTLTVPTGGGKTYSSLAFGLKHAAIHNMERVVYVIPYTSIIEQNAGVFRKALENSENEEAIVLEHHSNFEYPEEDFEVWNTQKKMHRIAAENWDVPVVVTTNVQFFESLYANKGSRCRKLHNIANSVIILDEAQMIPIEYMKPCLWALAELVINYGVTVVFCTATQPAVKELIPGNLKVTEIMENPKELQKTFKRVSVEYNPNKVMTDDELAQIMADKAQVLTIVNTRKHARVLFEKLLSEIDEGVYHLSARMCSAHRKKILAEIRQALDEKRPCRVVSTQLIEAGVDVDFSYVYRSVAGIDSIAQAAGRCNREGKRKEGQVTVFEPEKHGMPQKGSFSAAAAMTRSTGRRIHDFEDDLMSLGAIEDYFKQLLDLNRDKLDSKDILKMVKDSGSNCSFPFVDIANAFQLIDSPTIAVVVPFDERANELLRKAEFMDNPIGLSRQLQPYVVQIYQYEMAAFEKAGAIKRIGEWFYFVSDSSFYDKQFGLKEPQDVTAPTDILIW